MRGWFDYNVLDRHENQSIEKRISTISIHTHVNGTFTASMIRTHSQVLATYHVCWIKIKRLAETKHTEAKHQTHDQIGRGKISQIFSRVMDSKH